MRRHTALLAVLASAVALMASSPAVAGPAPAASTTVTTQDPADSCGHRSIDVARWVPSLGPAARFIVDSSSTFVALGRTDEGFWSTQRTRADACDDCDELDLVFTRWSDGKSTRYPVLGNDVRQAVDRRLAAGGPVAPGAHEAARKEVMLRRLWHYAATVWPVATLRHDYAVVTPRPEPDGSAAFHRGWLVGVVQAGRSRLRFTTDQRHFMCWCNESWRSLVPKL